MNEYPKLKEHVDILRFLLVSLDNLVNRSRKIESDLETAMERMNDVVNFIQANPEVDLVSAQLQEKVKDIHYRQLEIIQKLNVMVEVFAYYHYLIRTDFRRITERMLSKRGIDLRSEIQYLKSMNSDDVARVFRLPSPNELPLSSGEKENLRKILTEHVRAIIEEVNYIVRFRESYLEVYNKYKHSFSELTGFIGIDKQSGNIDSAVYVRSKEFAGRGIRKIVTYYVGSGTDAVKYYYDVAAAVFNLTKVLLESVALFINNGMNSLPSTYLGKQSKDEIERITKQLFFMRWPTMSGIVTRKPITPEMRAKMQKEMTEVFIYKLERDILGSEATEQVEIEYTKGDS